MAPLNDATAQTLEHVNAMPTPTWYRMHVNETDVEIPAGLTCAHEVEIAGDTDCVKEASDAASDAFEIAVAEMQKRIDEQGGSKNSKNDANSAAGKKASAINEDAPADPLDKVALSASQARSQDIESSGLISEAFRTGMGEDAFRWLREAADTPQVIASAPDQKDARISIALDGVADATNVCALDVIVAEGTHLTLSVVYRSSCAGTGVVGSAVRVFAGKNAQIDIIVTQALDMGWIALSDMGIIQDDAAQVNVRHSILGSQLNIIGLASDLRGDESQITVDTRYLGHDDQKLDFNYIITHHGRTTQSNMDANGVLSGTCVKTLRGTIDLIRGGKGAAGSETETVLLADEDVINHTVPVILCGEDDVAGNHGATIGHVRPEQRFYLKCRGLDDAAIEHLFSRAVLEEAYLNAPDDATRVAVSHCSDALFHDTLEDLSA